MNEKKIRFGIVGVGMMGRVHLTNLMRNPHAEVIALCSRTKSKVDALAAEFGIDKSYTDINEMLSNPDIDAVVIATGADAHKEACKAACTAKKHIFCEKPLAKTIDDCLEIEKYVEENSAKNKKRRDWSTNLIQGCVARSRKRTSRSSGRRKARHICSVVYRNGQSRYRSGTLVS